jgi:hypothetical protein
MGDRSNLSANGRARTRNNRHRDEKKHHAARRTIFQKNLRELSACATRNDDMKLRVDNASQRPPTHRHAGPMFLKRKLFVYQRAAR